MTYSVKNHPGGQDIYKGGEYLPAEDVIRLLEQRDRFELLLMVIDTDIHVGGNLSEEAALALSRLVEQLPKSGNNLPNAGNA